MSNVEETTKTSTPEIATETRIESTQPEISSSSVQEGEVKASPFAGLTAAAPSTSTNKDDEGEADDNDDGEVEASVDVHFEPVIKLEQVETRTLEEEEITVFKIRAKLFRFEKSTNEWKERGTGDVRLLQHGETKKIRLVMRRDKTLKVCANHLITESMKLVPNVGSDRSWVYTTLADVSEGEPRAELLAIRFATPEHANLFKEHFERAQKINSGETDVPEITTQLPEDIRKEAKEKAAEAKECAAAAAACDNN